MKSLVTSIALLFIAVMVISSCDDDKDSSPSNPIVGTWVMESLTLSDCDDEEDNGIYDVNCTATTCSKVKTTKDGKFTSTITIQGITETDHGTYEIVGDEIEICGDGGTDCDTSGFELTDNNKKLHLIAIDEESGCVTSAVYKKM